MGFGSAPWQHLFLLFLFIAIERDHQKVFFKSHVSYPGLVSLGTDPARIWHGLGTRRFTIVFYVSGI